MSHVAGVECQVQDLDVLREACERLGLVFLPGQRTHRWFGKWLDDWRSERAASNKGYDPKTFGTCDHAIGVRGNPGGYEIGVTAAGDGTYRLVYDSFGMGGQALERAAGQDLGRLQLEVAAVTVERHARQRGQRVTRQDEGQRVRLVLTR